MKELFLNYQLSKDLEDLGLIVIDRLAFVGTDDRIYMCHESYAPNSSIDTLLWSQAFDWFSKEYNLQSSIKPVTNVTEIGYAFDIVTIKFNMIVSKFPLSRKETKYYKTHEDAREACLKKLIKIGKEIQKNNTRTGTKTF